MILCGTEVLGENSSSLSAKSSSLSAISPSSYNPSSESSEFSDDDQFDYEFGMHHDRSNRKQQLLDAGGWGPSTGTRDPSPGGSYKDSRGRSPSDRDLSPRAGNKERSLSPLGNRLGSVSPIRGLRRSGLNARHYPTEPIITHDACTLTKKHKEFDKLCSGELKPRVAKLPNRSVMCYISGRKHTWVSVDWCCNRLLEDGDTLVVIASINPSLNSSLSRRFSSVSGGSNQPNNRNGISNSDIPNDYHKLMSDDRIKKSPEYAKIVTENLMKYILAIINPNKIIKITIEFAVGSTKDVLKDMYSLYLPSIVVIAAKPALAVSTRSWVTSRITDRLVKNFPVPVIIVPSMNMNLFENKLFKALNRKVLCDDVDEEEEQKALRDLDFAGFYELEDQRAELLKTTMGAHILKEYEHKINPTVHDEAIELDDSENSEDSEDGLYDDGDIADNDEDFAERDELFSPNTSVPQRIIDRIQLTSHAKIYLNLSERKNKPLNEDTFKDWLCIVSEAAYNYGMNLAERAKSGGESAKLVRTITGAPDPTYGKKKSMLLDEPKGSSSLPTLNLKGKSTSTFKVPMIQVDSSKEGASTSPSLSPTTSASYNGVSSQPRSSTSLKFEIQHPKYGHTNEKSKVGASMASDMPELLPSRSSPQLSTVKSSSSINSSSKEKKKGGFMKKLFGGKKIV